MKELILAALLIPMLWSNEKVELAKHYFREQDQEKAFKIFLEALDEGKVNKPHRMTAEEEALYKEAILLYLGRPPEEAEFAAKEIDQKFTPILEKNKEFTSLGFVLAVADANLSRFDRFFDLFYASFINDPEHYLAYKTKAVLHIKLFERAKTEGEREKEREKILQLARIAKDKFGSDFGLDRLIVAFTKPEEKIVAIKQILNKIVNQNMIPARKEVFYFTELALETGDENLIQEWLKKALAWYPDSRALKQLQKDYGAKNTR